MAELFSAPAGFIVQSVEQGYRVVIASEQQENPYSAGTLIPSDVNIFCRKVVTENNTLYEKNASALAGWRDNPEVANDNFESYLGLPIHWPDGEVFGTICVMDFVITDYAQKYLDLMTQLRDMVEDDLAMLNSYAQMREIAMLDPLTGIYNRRALSLLAQQKLNLAARIGFNVCCLFIDINDFKSLNDTFGHEVGDKALIALGDTLKKHLREADIIGRFGGDEFVAVLQVNESSSVNGVIEKIKQSYFIALEQQHIQPLSLSIGASFSEQHLPSYESLLKQADENMYINKQIFKKAKRNA